MKKIFVCFLIFLFSLLATPCFAISELYYLENVNKQNIASTVENVLTDKNYNIEKKDPYLAIRKKNNQNYSVIVLQKDGANLYYYFESNTKSKKLNKAILKNFKKNEIVYNQMQDSYALTNFAQVAQRTLTGEKKVYSFEEPKVSAVQPVVAVKTPVKQNPNVLKGSIVKTGKGQELDVYLQTPISTATAKIGDSVVGVLKTSWIINDNFIVADQGSILNGTVTEARCAQVAYRNGYVQLSFNQIQTPEGKIYDISSKKIDFNVTNEGVLKRTVSRIATFTLIGAIIGVIGGLICGETGGSLVSSAVFGASMGGTLALPAVFDMGIDAEIPAYTDIEVVLDKNINIVMY